MKPGQVVLEGHDGAPQPTLQPTDLDCSRQDALVRSPYFTAAEAMAYVRRPTIEAFYAWRRRRGVRAFNEGGSLLFTKADLDEALKPAAERGRRRHFASVSGGRS